MKATLFAMSFALLMVGCGEEAQKKAVQNEAKDDPSVPAAIPCMACEKPVSKKTEKCLQCGHPTPDSVVAYKKAQELARIRDAEYRRLAAIRAEEERKAKPFGGLETLVKIKEAKESGATKLDLSYNQISDVSPLKELTNLEELILYGNQITEISPLAGLTKLEHLWIRDNKISDLSPLAGLTNLEVLHLGKNKISDVTPLAELTKLERLTLNINKISDLSPLKGLTKLGWLDLSDNQITDISPLAELTNLKWLELRDNTISDLSPVKGLKELRRVSLSKNQISDDQKSMLKKALPNCEIEF